MIEATTSISNKTANLVSTFFLFAFLDQQRCRLASIEATTELGTQLGLLNSDIVRVTHKVWRKQRGHFRKKNVRLDEIENNPLFIFKAKLERWKEFLKSATEDELLCLIWSGILHFSDLDIAQGLNISEGVVRYRIGRALRKLGGQPQVSTGRGIKI